MCQPMQPMLRFLKKPRIFTLCHTQSESAETKKWQDPCEACEAVLMRLQRENGAGSRPLKVRLEERDKVGLVCPVHAGT